MANDSISCLEVDKTLGLVVTGANTHGEIGGLAPHIVSSRRPRKKLVVVSGKVSPFLRELPSGARFVAKPYTEEKMLQAVERRILQ